MSSNSMGPNHCDELALRPSRPQDARPEYPLHSRRAHVSLVLFLVLDLPCRVRCDSLDDSWCWLRRIADLRGGSAFALASASSRAGSKIA
jgi:hypothetical protein